jgi:hypothetical protein
MVSDPDDLRIRLRLNGSRGLTSGDRAALIRDVAR